jgi:uncharacterized protein (TIGR03000 family)
MVAAPPVAVYGSPMLASTISTVSPTTTSLYYNPDPDANRRATIIVHLPANAKLSVDGKATRSTSTTRRFVSPPLEAGQSYHYVFKAEAPRDGEPATVSKRVDVQAGQTREITLQFNDQDQPAERKQAPAQPVGRKDVFGKRVRAGQS